MPDSQANRIFCFARSAWQSLSMAAFGMAVRDATDYLRTIENIGGQRSWRIASVISPERVICGDAAGTYYASGSTSLKLLEADPRYSLS